MVSISDKGVLIFLSLWDPDAFKLEFQPPPQHHHHYWTTKDLLSSGFRFTSAIILMTLTYESIGLREFCKN